MLKVGLTGGMACGKSVVGEMFARLGAHVVQADKIAHELMQPGERVYDEIVARFGREVLAPDGTIDRVKLANAVFANVGVAPGGPAAEDGGVTTPGPAGEGTGGTSGGTTSGSGTSGGDAGRSRIGELNAIVHPAVIARQDEWMNEIGRREPGAIAMVEAALIYEAGVESHFDRIIVVTCDPAQKIERLASRANLTAEAARAEVERRSAAQLPDLEKARRADYVIYNTGSLAETEAQAKTVFAELKREALARAGES